jgi:hypothetical protein
MDKHIAFESLDDELFAAVPPEQLAKVAAGYIVSSSNKYEHTGIHGVVDVENVD